MSVLQPYSVEHRGETAGWSVVTGGKCYPFGNDEIGYGIACRRAREIADGSNPEGFSGTKDHAAPAENRSPAGHATEPLTWDVEMEGHSGHTCHVYVIADSPADAQQVATAQFPELELTHNTREA